MINIIRAMERSRLDIHACARLLYTRTEARGATGTLSMAPNEPIGSISRARYDTSNQSRCYEFHRIFRPCRNFVPIRPVPIPMKPSISFHNFHFCTKPKFHRACPSILVSRSNATINARHGAMIVQRTSGLPTYPRRLRNVKRVSKRRGRSGGCGEQANVSRRPTVAPVGLLRLIKAG